MCVTIYIYLGFGDPIQVLIFVWQVESLPQTAKELWAPPAGRLALLTTQTPTLTFQSHKQLFPAGHLRSIILTLGFAVPLAPSSVNNKSGMVLPTLSPTQY